MSDSGSSLRRILRVSRLCEELGHGPDTVSAMTDAVQMRQALQGADTIMGHDDAETEWRERWAHLWVRQTRCGAGRTEMTDPKIPAPERFKLFGADGWVADESPEEDGPWVRFEDAETYAAAREAAARMQERETHAAALEQARMEGVRSVQEQTGVIVRAALELLESVEGHEPFTAESMRAFKRVFSAG
jgi:hypothetical protein